MAIDEGSKEEKIVEYSQPPSQDTEVQAIGSMETASIEGESSQQEMTPSKSDKGKGVVQHTPSSSRAKSMEKHILSWIQKEIMRMKKPQFHASEDDICDIVEILNKLESPSHEEAPLEFFTTIWNQELFAQVALPPKGIDVEVVNLEDYEVKFVILGKLTRDST